MTWTNRQKQKAERETSDGGRLGCKVTIYMYVYINIYVIPIMHLEFVESVDFNLVLIPQLK